MGLIEKIFGRQKPQGKEMAHLETFTAYSPVFTSWGGQLYESALVREAIYAKGRHIMKLRFDMRGSAKRDLYNDRTRGARGLISWSGATSSTRRRTI